MSKSTFNLFREKNFLPLFLTQFFGAFNDNVFKNALVIYIAFYTTTVLGLPSAQAVVLCAGIFILPYFLFSATAGQLADKVEKSRLIRMTKVTEIIIMIFAMFGFFTKSVEVLILLLFFMGLQSTFFGPLKYSILPQHLLEEELIAGNAYIESGTFLAILLGTITGGVLVGMGEKGTHLVGAVLVLVAVLGWITSLKIPKAMSSSPDLKVKWDIVRSTVEILKVTKRKRSVFFSILGISWFWFFGAAFLSVFPIYCKDFLHSGESVVTLFLAIFSIGIGLGSILCEKISGRTLELGLVPLGTIGMTVFAFDLFFVGLPMGWDVGGDFHSVQSFLLQPKSYRILSDLLFLSIFSGFFIVPLYTLIQERSDNEYRSRIIAGNNIINALFMVISSLILGVMLTAHFSVPQIYLFLAICNALVAIYIYTLLPEFFLRFTAWGLAKCIYRMRVTGQGNIPNKGAAVLVCNHVTFIDWLIIAACIKRPVRFVMDYNFVKGFLLKKLFRDAKVIPIASAKESSKVLAEAFRKIALELRDDELVCIFPEGRLTPDGDVHLFKAGVEKIISETPVPVIPMALQNLWGSFFSRKEANPLKRRPRKFWSRVKLKIGEAIPPHQVSAADLQEKVTALRGKLR